MKADRRKRTALCLAGILCLALLAGCGKQEETKETAGSAEQVTEAPGENISASGIHHIEIDIKDYGTIRAELYEETAPITVKNFLDLAGAGFYDGLTFHRIIDGFMIQGGDPTGTGAGGSKQNIKGEFSGNGVPNDLSHKRGVLSMARAQNPDSASSQFFIVQTDSTFLDGQYAAFGMVTEGIEIVDKICKDTPVTDGNGSVNREDQPVIEAVRVVD